METEIKIRIADRDSTSGRLRQAGLRVSQERRFESNTIYDTKDRALKRIGKLLRLRQAGEQYSITWKGPCEAGRHKSRPELETAIASCEVLDRILLQLGFEPSFRYEKYRTEFADGGAGVVTLDETPIGDFVELEGPGEWIDGTAARLGFAPSDYILDSYAKLYLADCERRGVQPENMIFASQREGEGR
ncbi:MAG: class IV adenylate cyclase [Bryobacteraceae bacterium]